MATYSTIKGFNIQTLSSDPYAAEFLAGTWASGGTMNNSRTQAGGLGTSASAGMIVGGAPPSGPVGIKAESYDGTSWTEFADMNGGRSDMGTSVGGSLTAALIYGGDGRPGGQPQVSALTENFNGTSWTEVADLNTALRGVTGAGTSTAALSLGGQINPTTIPTGVTETWNGTSWTNGAGFVNTERSVAAGFGTATAALMATGRVPPAGASNGSVFTESYDGSTWVAVADCNQQRYLGAEGGTQTAGILMGGQGPSNAVCEAWNGTSWTTIASLANDDTYNAGFGSGNSTGVSAAGDGVSDTCEEFAAPATTRVAQEGQVWYNSGSNVLKGFGAQGTGAWASGGAMLDLIADSTGVGIQTAALGFSGYTPGVGASQETTSYDGNAWTELNDMNTARYGCGDAGTTSTAALCVAGLIPPTTNAAIVEEWDGTNWTEIADINTGRIRISGTGTTTAALATGGFIPPAASALNESWNGTSWTEIGDLNTARYEAAEVGTQAAALMVGGDPTNLAVTEIWDGTSWTEVGDLNSGRGGLGGVGTTTGALVFGGNTPNTTLTESYNGTAWTELADLASGRDSACAAGVGPASALFGGGGSPPTRQLTEEFTVPDAIKTFTAS